MRRPIPASWPSFEYFRRVGGFRARAALALARAERWSSDSGLELGIELGVAYLHHRRVTEEQGQDGWDRQGWEYSEPLIVMPRPKGVSDRITAAILAAKLIASCATPVHLPA